MRLKNIEYYTVKSCKKFRPPRIPIKNKHAEEIVPVFIVGSPRSGNTLLRKLMVQHGYITIPPETYELGRVIRGYYKYRNFDWRDLVTYVAGAFAFNSEFQDTFGYTLEDYYNQMRGLTGREQNMQNLIIGFYCEYARRNGYTNLRWGDKTPLNTFSIYWIKELFPLAKFIWMERDPVDAISSHLESKLVSDFDAALQRWLSSTKIMEDFSRDYSGAVIKIRYEELVKNTDNIIDNMFRFCNIEKREQKANIELGDVDRRPHHTNVESKVNETSIGKGYKKLEQNQIDKIIQATKHMYAKL